MTFDRFALPTSNSRREGQLAQISIQNIHKKNDIITQKKNSNVILN